MRRWLISALVLLLGRSRPRREHEERIVPEVPPNPHSEIVVILLFLAAAACAAAFPVIYAVDSIPRQTQLLGLSLGLALGFIAAACVVISKRLVAEEQLEEEYPPEQHVSELEAIEQIVDESGDGITRKRLLLLAGGAAGGALGVALLTPAASLGPVFDVTPFFETPWRRGVRLVDERGRVFYADDVLEDTFYTAYPEGADTEALGSPVVVVRLQLGALRLPPERRGWAPKGILAYSKICTHAGCAIALYRKPTFAPVEPRPALVCPCHYSTFDPAAGGAVLFGPAGRPLPQLPLLIDHRGELRAAGNFSGAIGPSWWGVKNRRPRST